MTKTMCTEAGVSTHSLRAYAVKEVYNAGIPFKIDQDTGPSMVCASMMRNRRNQLVMLSQMAKPKNYLRERKDFLFLDLICGFKLNFYINFNL